MPLPGSMAEVLFVVVSCNAQVELGAWRQLQEYIKRAKPRFLLMIGDQIYLDDTEVDKPNVFTTYLHKKRSARRQAIADAYQESWSREAVREVLANIPTYMMWDDHDIRDGWGSMAPDSPTLAQKYPRGAGIHALYNNHFEDARAVYWHFQRCQYPPAVPAVLKNLPDSASYELPAYPGPGERTAMPYVFRCGRLVILMLDSRGERDLWRAANPVLGDTQWKFVHDVAGALNAQDDALAVVTSVPIVAMGPDGQAQFMLGRRTDDVEMFKRGDLNGLLHLLEDQNESAWSTAGNVVGAVLSGYYASRFGISLNAGGYKIQDLDDVRDQWSNHFSRPEQERLIRTAGAARLANRTQDRPRGVIFLGGDLHAGALFDISVDAPGYRCACLISSGISKKPDSAGTPLRWTLVDENFTVADGIRAELRALVANYNFGVVQMVPTGGTPHLLPALGPGGMSPTWGVRLRLPV
jgi:hypothetical protein